MQDLLTVQKHIHYLFWFPIDENRWLFTIAKSHCFWCDFYSPLEEWMDFFIFSLIAIMWNSCLLWLLANEHALIVALGDGNKQVWSEDYITNYLLISLARAVLGNIGPRSFFVRTERTTTGQYSSVRPLHSVSKRLIFLL